MTFEEHRVRDIHSVRRGEADRYRLVAATRRRNVGDVRVWSLGALVVAWRPRRRRFDQYAHETPIVVWV